MIVLRTNLLMAEVFLPFFFSCQTRMIVLRTNLLMAEVSLRYFFLPNKNYGSDGSGLRSPARHSENENTKKCYEYPLL